MADPRAPRASLLGRLGAAEVALSVVVIVVVALLVVPLPTVLLGALLAAGLVGGQREQRNL